MAAAGAGRGRWASIAVVALLSVGASAADPAPGGPDRLALVEETARGQDVVVIDVSRGTVTRAARGLTEIDRLVWSPDGGRLAFGGTSGARHEIFVARSDGSALQRMADGRSPSWSPDGTRIAFAASQDGGEEVFVVRLDSGARDRLTASPGRDITPLWGPDGTRIAFASGRGESSRLHGQEYGTEIHLMGADGSGARALTGGKRMRPCHGERGKAQQPRSRRLDTRRPAPPLSRRRVQDGLQGLRR